MKNMKKLLGAVAALGFSTVSAVNVVACSNSNPAKSNDLDKSFETNYSIPSSSLFDSGLVANGNKFDFTFGADDNSGLKQTLIATILKPKTGATINQASIKKQQNETTAPNFPAATKDALAVGVIGTNQSGLTADANRVVKVPIKLVLWKSVAAGNGFKWEKQNVTKDITLNITTIIDISTIIPGTITLGQLSDDTVGAFKTALQAKLITFQNLKTINTSDYDVYKAGTGKNLITDSDVAKESPLSIKIVAKGDNFTGTKDNITANYIRTITHQDTIYIDSNGQQQTTSDRDLENLNTTEIIQIGFYTNDQEKIQVVEMPKTVLKVPNQLPPEITSLENMFAHTISFNQDLSTWDTSHVTDMMEMFLGAQAFNQNISTWDTSHVTNMKQVFSFVKTFNQDISKWDTSNVTNMGSMFNGASTFNQDISSWDTSNVTNMKYMFYQASAFNQDISKWNTSQVTDMSDMFADATAFNQDLSKWNVSKVTDHTQFALRSGFADESSKQPKFNN